MSVTLIMPDGLHPEWSSARAFPSDPGEERLRGPMRGWKAFDDRLGCRPVAWRRQQYAVGTTFRTEGDIRMCAWGMHFCDRRLSDVYNWYDTKVSTRVCEVETPPDALVIRQGTKCVTNILTVVRELTMHEILSQVASEVRSLMDFPDMVHGRLQSEFLLNCDLRPKDCPDWKAGKEQTTKEIYGDSLH